VSVVVVAVVGAVSCCLRERGEVWGGGSRDASRVQSEHILTNGCKQRVNNQRRCDYEVHTRPNGPCTCRGYISPPISKFQLGSPHIFIF
jgi:hypothetical protein